MAVPDRPAERARTPRGGGPRRPDVVVGRTDGTRRAAGGADRTPSSTTRRPPRTELEARSRRTVVAKAADDEWSHSMTGELPIVRADHHHADGDDGDHRETTPIQEPAATAGPVTLVSNGDLAIVMPSAFAAVGLNGSVDVFAAPTAHEGLEALPTGPISLVGPATLPVPVTAGEPLLPAPLQLAPAIEPAPPGASTADRQPGAHAPAGPPRRFVLRRRGRVRRVSRVVRRVDAWSVLKISAILYALIYGILLVAGVLLWKVANETGTVANIEGFVKELFGLQTFKLNGKEIYRASWRVGALLVLAGTGANVTAAVMFNLITDLVGGVRVTVLEEEVRVVERKPRRRLRKRTPEAG